MKKRFTTWSGSVYTIDSEAKTWERIPGHGATVFDNLSGTFDEVVIVELGGLPPFLYILPQGIRSTPIMKVEDIEDEASTTLSA